MLTRITAVEARLFFREPGVWLLTILLPTIVLVVVGSLFGTEADPALGGRRWIDIFAPSMVVMTLAILGVNTLPEYIEWLKKNPARQSFGTTAMGSFTHFFGVMAGREIGIPLEPVPYRGAAPLVADLQGGHIAAGCGGITDFLEHHRAGKVKVIFTSGQKPTTSAPEIPTVTQLGYPKISILGWYFFCTGPKTPQPMIDAWGTELRAVLKLPEIEKRMTEFGLDVETSTAAAFSERMATDLKRWKEIIDSIGYKPT